MAKVYKYPIAGKIMLPKGSKILTVCAKADGNFLYAQVPDNEQEAEPHYFYVVPTGIPFDDTGCTYIGSYIEGDFLFLGGEPCLFLDELIDCVAKIKAKTVLKVFVTTSVPKVCYDKRDKFIELIEMLDGINLSVQHYNEDVADSIRRTKSAYDRQTFYASLPHKEKIRINLNIVKPFLYTMEDISACLRHYDAMGFNSIKLSEIQHGEDVFVSFERVFGIKMKSPYSSGCQTYLDMDKILPGFKTPLLLKRSCFMCEETLKASLADGVKVLSSLVRPNPKNKYGVIYEDGTLMKGWV